MHLKWLRRLFWPVDIEKERVTAELKQADLRLKKLDIEVKKAGPQDQDEASARRKIRQDYLELAATAIDAREYFSAWGHLLAFNRDLLDDLHDADLDARLASASAEALQKLPSWRGRAVETLLMMKRNASEQEKRDRLREILFHLHTKSQNMYFKIAKLRNQTVAVIWMLLIASLCVLGLSFWFMQQTFFAGISRFVFQLAMLAGLVGSVLSVAFSVIRTDPGQRIPDLKTSFPLTWARSFFGPLVAFVLLVFISTNLINLGEFKAHSLIGLSFIAGFSERWFLNLVERAQDQAGI